MGNGAWCLEGRVAVSSSVCQKLSLGVKVQQLMGVRRGKVLGGGTGA